MATATDCDYLTDADLRPTAADLAVDLRATLRACVRVGHYPMSTEAACRRAMFAEATAERLARELAASEAENSLLREELNR